MQLEPINLKCTFTADVTWTSFVALKRDATFSLDVALEVPINSKNESATYLYRF